MTINQQKLRTLLIERASQRKLITYGEVAKKINTDWNKIRFTLPNVLDAISTEEHKQKAPLLSVVVVDQDNQKPGKGFFAMARGLGFEVKDEDAFFEKMRDDCFDYWAPLSERIQKEITKNEKPLPFFTKSEVEHFHKYAQKTYNKNDKKHREAGEKIKSTYEKLGYWTNTLAQLMGGFEADYRADWLKRGQSFVQYLWARVRLAAHQDKGIYFVVGVSGDGQSLYIELNYGFGGNKEALIEAQQNKARKLLGDSQYREDIELVDIEGYDWATLLEWSRAFVTRYQPQYLQALYEVYGQAALTSTSALSLNSPPKASPKPRTKTGKSPRSANNVNYIKKAIADKALGDVGEWLVIAHEVKKLLVAGRPNFAQQVKKQPDSAGYDILSFDEQGKELYIEVKTTRQSAHAPFYMSAHERKTAQELASHYYVYRLYNYDDATNTAKFYILQDLEEKVDFEPTNFKVSIK